MGNIKNFNFNKLDLKLSNSDYWDFYLSTDEYNNCNDGPPAYGECLVVWYDFNNPTTFANSQISATSIYSLVTWNQAINTGYTFNTIGLTGIDNGLVLFNKTSGDTSNLALLSALTGTTLVIPSGDTRLQMTRVTGTTGNFIYPIDIISGTTTYAQFCGGFYQGYYKIDGYSYEVLPTRINQAWAAEFWLNKQDICTYTGTTLNDIYPNNKGFFFYMGTRAENKYWNIFYGNNTGCTLDCESLLGCTDTVTKFCTKEKESDIQIFDYDTGYNIYLDPPRLDIKVITNQFLIYGRARTNGSSCGSCGAPRDSDEYGKKTVCNFTGTSITTAEFVRKKTDDRNQFLIYGRAKTTNGNCGSCGAPRDSDTYGRETVCSYSGDSEVLLELDKNLDVFDNAIGFRITDDGRIGYKALKYYCSGTTSGSTTGVTVEEQYSLSGVIKNDEWTRVTIRFVADDVYTKEQLNCLPARKGKLMFYVDCKLKAVFKDVDEFIGRRLDEYKGKQIGIPFNISLGGGSQGLIESMTFDGQDSEDLGLLIEKNFAGTFIGQISQFKFNICDMNWCDISVGCLNQCNRYGLNCCS